MLGELIYESKGRITCQRVLSTEIWTYWNMQRSNSITYGEGQGVLTTIDGSEVATVTGRGEGKLIDSGLMRWNGTNIFLTTSNNRLAFLDHLIGVNEDEIDASGSYVHRLWEWK
jgi:hypothetical protein